MRLQRLNPSRSLAYGCAVVQEPPQPLLPLDIGPPSFWVERASCDPWHNGLCHDRRLAAAQYSLPTVLLQGLPVLLGACGAKGADGG